MKKRFLAVPLALLLFSCASLKKTGNGDSHISFLGAIGKTDNSMFHHTFLEIGRPKLDEPISVSVQETQFRKQQFKKYEALKSGKGEKTGIAFADSLSTMPKYLCLEISDKIALQSQLNGKGNAEVLSYLSKDEYVIVSKVALVTDAETRQQLVNAEGIFLSENSYGLLGIEIIKGNDAVFLNPSRFEVFDYEVSGFCWGKNRYGKLRIEAIPNRGDECPKGAELKPHKLKEPKSYLKL